ncbi:ABC transporter ATP-binding protein [Rhizobium sp. CG5]|uniref:ABC transporter ATP-binding protein n=1 Tax=Rhizobium sp. CG5 TaxID=2726076 RepID=UPI0020337C3D|nr:ABC transporter ATP-binding protein [Rhizobium sp. CG5]MCM2474542.1 ABC transporter ATP-binding protein [Rhizobium sp. CG5]
MIEAERLGFRYASQGSYLFQDLSFTLDKGRTLVLLGRNGRGKTTLLRILAGLAVPVIGSVRCGGAVGYVPQQFVPAFNYSVLDVVLMGRARHVGLFSRPSARDRRLARDALDLVGMVGFTERAVATLSGGERQLVLIARALASEAAILLLDEPASALDFHNQAIMLSMLRRLSRERGLTIVMTTHEPTHALEIADQVALLYGKGRCEQGPMEQFCTEDRLSDLYGIAMDRLEHQAGDARTAHIVARYSAIDI